MTTSPIKVNTGIPKMLAIVLVLFITIGGWVGIRLFFPDKLTLFAGTPPTNIGVNSGKLAPCPNTPNCVSSYSQDAVHKIAPLVYNSTSEEAIENLKKIIQSQPRTKIIAETDNYIYAEFSTPLMGFVDDVEFYLIPEAKIIQVRSASRLGESDLGVNRDRIETIRAELQKISNNT